MLTQTPISPSDSSAAQCALDLRYPPGSRVILTALPPNPNRLQVLSQGLTSAGSPSVSYDGQRILFTGKSAGASDWQIYETWLSGGRPQVLTSMPGGASDPVLLPDGSLVFASPVPKLGANALNQPPSALYRQSPGAPPQQLTFGPASASDPAVLSDGRILFVSAPPSPLSSPRSGSALYTINNDGTEISVFTGQHDRPTVLHRPRQLPDGRVAFVISKSESAEPDGSAEFVRMAGPFKSRAQLFASMPHRFSAVEPANNGDLLLCAENSPGISAPSPTFALFRTEPTSGALGEPLLSDPAWSIVEAVEAGPHTAPMGRLSSVDLTKRTGRLLCLDANYAAEHSAGSEKAPTAAHVRILTSAKPGQVYVLGEVPVQADGSFLTEVPADIPLGFETLDAHGLVLNRVAPVIWVRPGENRSCIGCHEPPNHSPHNFRPLALQAPIAPLCADKGTLASKQP